MDDRIASALELAFPDRDADTVGSAGISWNEKNNTVCVEFADRETVYLKVASDDDGSRIARETAVIPYVDSHTDVPVPTILTREADGPVPYIATAPVSGPNLVELWTDAVSSERVALAREVGASLARVHELRFETHGLITDGDATSLELDSGPWTDVLVETIAHMRELAPSERFDHHFDKVTQAVVENRKTLDGAPAALLHGDLAQPNCFRTASGLGFLDWEIAHVGDPARDLYRAKVQLFDSLRSEGPAEIIDAFYDGYRSVAGGLPDGYETRRPIYAAVRFLGVSGFFDKYAEFRDEDMELFADWVDSEMTRRLDRLES
ncbi:aminoglycoside phosphotransferase family protein [Haloferax mediterranei ATCC 33500]|nr:phosphotransferase [Haloferax mediterranei]AHZ21475.1 aminoglycoside phosphotransferase [Haloferax mediterranei ATCC 33500]EMA03935.1 phosphotransferase [Haloferax mediterranei ATCC 33500]MDX5989261.1 phosphotransferase [Haloferax mediterranei ATCC 33500]QCQ75632.1 aminoglycoside phosphotransferase family protein [Haloferax mediterranei ATCC 33500]